jgi:drug/metabolite transporter (DMT)-like permease
LTDLTARAKAALLPAILAVSTAAIFIRSANVPPMAAAFWRSGFCAIIFVFALLSPTVRRALRDMVPKRMFGIFAATSIIALHQVCFITSLSYTSIAASTFLTCTQPIFTAFLGTIFLKEAVSWRSRVAIFGAVGGMAAITFGGGNGEAALTGNLLALAASVLAAVFVLFARTFRKTTPLVPFMLVMHVSGSIILMTLATVVDVPVTGFASESWTALLMLALIPTLIGHTLLNFAVGHLPAFVVSASILGEPVGATLLGWAIFSEVPTGWTLVGALLIVLCILIVVLEPRTPAIAEPSRD